MRRAMGGDFVPRAHTTLLNKDTHLALAMAREAGFEAPLDAAAAPTLARACEMGFDALDDASVVQLLRQARGTALRPKPLPVIGARE